MDKQELGISLTQCKFPNFCWLTLRKCCFLWVFTDRGNRPFLHAYFSSVLKQGFFSAHIVGYSLPRSRIFGSSPMFVGRSIGNEPKKTAAHSVLWKITNSTLVNSCYILIALTLRQTFLMFYNYNWILNQLGTRIKIWVISKMYTRVCNCRELGRYWPGAQELITFYEVLRNI